MARFGSSEGPGNPGSDPTQSIRHRQSGPQPPGPPPAPLGPGGPGYRPADAQTQYGPASPGGPEYRPADAQTQYGAAYNPFEQQAPPPQDVPNFTGQPPTPWFRRKPVLIAWVGLIAVMLALVIWGIIQLTSRGPGGSSTTPATTSSSTTSTSSTTSSTTTASTSASPSPSTAPPTAPPKQAPPKQPPAQQTPAPTSPSHRHRLPSLPSVITIPPIPKAPELPTVITIPPYR